MAKYEGNCFICNKTAGRTALKNHVLKEHNNGDEKCYLIRAEGAYHGSPHWLFFSIPLTAKLDDIDDFLREIWCECCGHMSSFSTRYNELPLTTKIAKLDVGDCLLYEYDFGSTTEILLTVVEKIKRPKQQEKVQLIARNVMPTEVCLMCNKTAEYIDAGTWGVDDFACAGCVKKCEDEDADWMPITNSPRSGVCGYDGGLDVWEFDPKGDNTNPERTAITLPKPDNVIQLSSASLQFEFLDEDFDDDDIAIFHEFSKLVEEELGLDLLSMSPEELGEFQKVFVEHIGFPTLEELREAGEIEMFLESCELMEPMDADEVEHIFNEGLYDELETYCKFITHTVEVLDGLTPAEKEGYDFSEIYASQELVAHAVDQIPEPIASKSNKKSKQVANNVIHLFDGKKN